MKNKTFIVSHPRARKPLTIKGTSLAAALKKERLDPAIWKQITPAEAPPEVNFGSTD